MTRVSHSSHFPVPADDLYTFHLDVENLAKISPPLPKFQLLSEPGPSEVGAEQRFRLSVGPFGREWHARITRLEAGRLVEDTQIAGPFLRWKHQHRVTSEGDGSRLTDVVSFRALPTPVGEFLEWLFVAPGIKGMFVYRHWRTRRLLRVESGAR